MIVCEPLELINEIRRAFCLYEQFETQFYYTPVADFVDYEPAMFDLLERMSASVIINKIMVTKREMDEDAQPTKNSPVFMTKDVDSVKDVQPTRNSPVLMAISIDDETDVRPKILMKRY